MSEVRPSVSVIPVPPTRPADRKPSLTSPQMLSTMGGSSSRKSSLTPEGMLLAMMAAGGPSRKPSLNSTALLNAMNGGSSSRKPSLTSEGMLSAMAVTQSRKPSLNSTSMLSAMAGMPGRKPSLTSTSLAAALAAASTSSSRERKPSLTSITGLQASQPAASPLAQGRKVSGDRKPSLSSVGMAALATAGAGASSRHLIGSPRSPSSRHLQRGSDASQSVKKQQQQQQNQLLAMKATRRSFSSSSTALEQRIELFFHVPTHRELQRLRVPRSLTLAGLQAMVQREFEIPFEDQRIYWHGDLLEGDEDLAFYDIHDQSVLNIRVRKRYRPIGDVFTKIKTVQFTSPLKPDDFEIVEIVAPLPPTHILFKRMVLAISYLQRLDKMQFERTQRRVWKQRVSFWEEPAPAIAAVTTAARRRSSILQQAVVAANPRTQRRNSAERQSEQSTPAAPAVASFVMLNSGPERVSYLVSLSQAHSIPQRLQVPADNRTPSDMRHIKKWLSGLKFFSSAALPDTAIHEIARGCVYVRYNAGDFLFRQGDIGDHFYILISGCISLAAFGNGFFATMTPGRCFGEISLIEGQSGLRTASATVNFATPFAELAVVSGDIFRRVINPYKRAVLQQTEKAIYTIPQLKSLPDHIITHIAYASKALDAKPGKLLVHHGEEVNVLVLLVKGEVKVSVTAKHCQDSSNQVAVIHPVVSVVRAPAVFCQEGALTNTPSAAPWDIEALDHCTLLCLRTDTISIFLAPRQEIIRALYREHTDRLQDFRRRFGHAAPLPRPPAATPTVSGDQTPGSRKSSAAKLAEKAAYMRMLKAKLFESQRSLFAEPSRRRSRRGATTNVQFPRILQRRPEPSDEGDDNDDESNRNESLESIHQHHQNATHQGLLSSASDSCADLEDQFLHRTLPFGNILELSEQIRFCSRAARELEEQQQKQCGGEMSEHARSRTRALLRGLRRLPVEEVELIAVAEEDDGDESTPPQYRFAVARPPTSPVSPSVRTNPQATAKRRTLQTR